MKRTRLSRGSNAGKKSRLKMTPADFLKKDLLTEQEVLLAKRRLNGGKLTSDDYLKVIPEGGWKITPDQSKKGLEWLMDQWKTPMGVERKNNPFGYREEAVLENFKEFRLTDFYDNVNVYQVRLGIHNYLPVYTVIARDKSSFQYYVDYKGIHIIG